MAGNIAPNTVTDRLVLYLDAGNTKSYQSGSTIWNNLIGNGFNGTLTNGPTFNTSGSGAIRFDGVDDYVIGSITPLSGSAFTICTWINPLVIPSDNTYFSIGTSQGTDLALHLRLVNNTTVRFALYADDLDTTITPVTGKWSYMVCTLDNSRLQSTYQNANLTGTRTASSMFIGNNGYAVGAWGLSPVIQHTNLNVGLVQVYNRSLNQSEITQNYNATKGYGITRLRNKKLYDIQYIRIT